MKAPPQNLIILALLLALLFILVQLGLLSVVFEKLGLSQQSAILLLTAALIGSWFNVPLFTMEAGPSEPGGHLPPELRRIWRMPPRLHPGRITIALNVGGAVVPVAFSAYLYALHHLSALNVGLGVAGVAAISYFFSRPIPGIGIGMPVLVAPVSAALIAMVINSEQAAPLAYVCGTLGVLLGADLLRLRDVSRTGAPLAAIGGAGTFDGIFLTGIVAVLLT